MKINFEGHVYAIDFMAIHSFIEILNAIIASTDPANLNKMLIGINSKQPILKGYFTWEFGDSRFCLKQRITYRSIGLFDENVLTVQYNSFDNHTTNYNHNN